MTRLKTPITLEIVERFIVTVTQEGVYIRERGRRVTYGPVSWGHLWLQGARLYVAEQDEAKLARRKRVRRGVLPRRAR